MANVFFKSRVPGVAGRETDVYVMRVANGYADLIRNARRFRFSHEIIIRDEAGASAWLVFEDAGPTT